jgi:hypothetical protein
MAKNGYTRITLALNCSSKYKKERGNLAVLK